MTNDALQALRRADPARELGIAQAHDPGPQALLRSVVSTEVRSRRHAALVASVCIAVGVVAGAVALVAALPAPRSAAASVRDAVRTMDVARSGRAVARVAGTQNGVVLDGTITAEWSDRNEAYVIESTTPDRVHYELRFVDGVGYRRTDPRLPWVATAGPGDVNAAHETGIARGPAQFHVLRAGLTFERREKATVRGVNVTRIEAIGSLRPLDSRSAGFLWGAAGLPGAHTTGLELWVTDDHELVRIRTRFSGADPTLAVRATVTTDLYDLGSVIQIERPSA